MSKSSISSDQTVPTAHSIMEWQTTEAILALMRTYYSSTNKNNSNDSNDNSDNMEGHAGREALIDS